MKSTQAKGTAESAPRQRKGAQLWQIKKNPGEKRLR
jgi:hypothetical protein